MPPHPSPYKFISRHLIHHDSNRLITRPSRALKLNTPNHKNLNKQLLSPIKPNHPHQPLRHLQRLLKLLPQTKYTTSTHPLNRSSNKWKDNSSYQNSINKSNSHSSNKFFQQIQPNTNSPNKSKISPYDTSHHNIYHQQYHFQFRNNQ